MRSDTPYKQWETGRSAVAGFNLGDLDPAALDITRVEFAGGGRSARGEAGFLELTDLMQGRGAVIPGGFEFTCPGP